MNNPTVLRATIAIGLLLGGCGPLASPTPAAFSSLSTSTPRPLDSPTLTASTPPPAAPSARGYHQMAYDSESNQVILFGGEADPLTGMVGGTWAYDLKQHAWSEITSERSPLPGASGDSIAYDIQSDRVILFVGSYFYGASKTPQGKPAGETWAFDFNNATWSEMRPGASPYGLAGARLAYDVESDRMILFGGADANTFQPLNETWAYDFESDSWETMDPTTSPPPMNFHSMAYDSESDRVILLGTSVEEGMWAYDFNGDDWQALEPVQMPPPRAYSSIVYDSGSGRTVLFGGASTPTEEPLGDMWAYDFAGNTWIKLTPDTRPSPRGWHASAYTTAAGLMLLFGGGPDRESFTAETWLYDSALGLWTLDPASP